MFHSPGLVGIELALTDHCSILHCSFSNVILAFVLSIIWSLYFSWSQVYFTGMYGLALFANYTDFHQIVSCEDCIDVVLQIKILRKYTLCTMQVAESQKRTHRMSLSFRKGHLISCLHFCDWIVETGLRSKENLKVYCLQRSRENRRKNAISRQMCRLLCPVCSKHSKRTKEEKLPATEREKSSQKHCPGVAWHFSRQSRNQKLCVYAGFQCSTCTTTMI